MGIHTCITSIFLGKKYTMFSVIWSAALNKFIPPMGGRILLRSNFSCLIYAGPPHGGLKNTTSAINFGANWKKSPTINSILSSTP